MSTEFRPDDERMIARAKQLLDQSVADLDPETALRLQRARIAALEARPAHRRWLVWTSGVATAAVAALAVTLWTRQPLPENHHAPIFEDMDLVISAENVELAEDLEFYHWLADADTAG